MNPTFMWVAFAYASINLLWRLESLLEYFNVSIHTTLFIGLLLGVGIIYCSEIYRKKLRKEFPSYYTHKRGGN